MTNKSMPAPGFQCACLLTVVFLGGATPAFAQSKGAFRAPCSAAPSVTGLFTGTLRDVGRLASRESLGLVAVGSVAAIGASSVDRDLKSALSDTGSLHGAFQPGAVIGGTPFELGAAFATYAIGRALNKPCAASLGGDLIRAQLMAEGLTIALKEVTRRSRPEGSGFSFPSGHTTVTFASATVLQRHFGWKVGVPAYAVASYVAASRVQMNRHYLSDVAFGAALGIVAGRTVTVGHRHRFMLTPMASQDGAGATLTWIGKE